MDIFQLIEVLSGHHLTLLVTTKFEKIEHFLLALPNLETVYSSNTLKVYKTKIEENGRIRTFEVRTWIE